MSKNITKQEALCGCGSGLEGEKCCLPILRGDKPAQTAEQLMRSRYMAYVLADEAYILSSWHPDTRPASLGLSETIRWTGLQVLQHKQGPGPAAATVEFIASFVDNGQPGQMHENSRFTRLDGRWYYLDGEQIEAGPQRAVKTPGRNDPCYCGSGRKYKKCCGRQA